MTKEEESGCCKNENNEDVCCEELPVEDVAHMAHDKVDALIGLLIKKGLVSEEDLQKEYDSMFNDD